MRSLHSLMGAGMIIAAALTLSACAVETGSEESAGAPLSTESHALGSNPLQDGTMIKTMVPHGGAAGTTFTDLAINGGKYFLLRSDGYIERWPFDSHSVDVAIVSLQGEGDDMTAIPTLLCGSAHVPGWTFSSEEIAGTDEVVVDGEPVTQIRVTATRSVATVAFGIVILGLMAVLPVLGLTVAIVAYRGIRKVEATLMSWMAAMLFATIPLRTFLPGSPPIGSWVDYLVVLWVVAGLVLGLVIYVLAWLRWGTRGERAAPDGSIAVVSAGAGAPASVPVSGSGDGASADGAASD